MEFFSLKNNDKKNLSNQKELLNIKELILKLDILFEEQLSKAFKDIMIIPRNNFLNVIISEVKNFLDSQYGEDIYKNEKFINFFSSACNNLENKYNIYLEELTKAWDDYQSNKQLNENSYFFSNFRKHCIRTGNYALHKCSDEKNGNFIVVIKKLKNGSINMKKKNIQNSYVNYLICNKCKSVYFINKFMNYCKECDINYLCSILSHNEDPDLLLATLEKPHCDSLVNEKIKCNKCKDNCLYLNMKLKRIQCHNKSCTYNEIPHNIEWTCNMCNKTFFSNIKVYNPVEVQQIKDIIKLTLLLKKKAHPNKVTCCKDINVLNVNFFHKKECKGLLYFGEYNNKTIVVCDKCRAINFLVKFIWTCPICETRFKDKGTIKNNKSYKKFLSPGNENKNQMNHNYNLLIENSNKKTNENNLNSSNYKQESRNHNSSRKNKETLLSMLKRRSEKNIIESSNDKNDYNSNAENNPNLNNGINEKNNINKDNKDSQNTDNMSIQQVKEINRNKRIKIRNGIGNTIEKSHTVSRINKTLKKKNSFLDKQIIGGNIEPIKEEIETKINSPSLPKINISEINTDKFNFQNSISIRNTRNSNKKNDKDSNCLSPNTNNSNSIYNNYLKYVSISSNRKENKDSKIYITYSKRQDEEETNRTKEEKKNNNKNEEEHKTYKRNFLRSYGHRTRAIIKDNKENNINEINNNINNTKIESLERKDRNKKEEKNEDNNNNYFTHINNNEESAKKFKNANTIMISYNRASKNYASTSASSKKYLVDKNKKNCHSQDNISDHNSSREENNQKNIFRNRTRMVEVNDKNDKNITKCEIIKHRHSTMRKNDALFSIMKIKKNLNYQDNIENIKENDNNEQTEKILTIRNRSIYKYKLKDKELQNNKETTELNKCEEENKIQNEKKNESIQANINQIRKRGMFKERIKNLKENDLEEENMKEKKAVRSRKETLKMREREKYSLKKEENEKEKEKEKINNINDKKDNFRYKQNVFESRQESVKTKENTISRYTKDSEISLDKNKFWANRLSGEHYNIKKYKDNGNNDNNEKNNKNNNENEYQSEIRKHFHTKKTRKDYINDKKRKNTEKIIKENSDKDIKTENKFISNKKNMLRSSFNAKIRNNDDLNLEDEEDIPIFDKELRKDKEKYNQLQRQLKLIMAYSSLPKFNIDYYVIKNQIGVGSFGVIFQVYNIKTRCKFALKKIIAPDINTLQQFEKEFELVHENPHPHILNFIGICIQCVDLSNFIFYVLMDLAEEDWDTAINNRYKIKKYYSEFELISILKQLTSALNYLQKEKKIAHRDIKPENILIFKNDIYKIGDFGEAKESKVSKQLSTLRGTELYMSPLLYNGLHENKDDVRHNPFKSDVFSLGYCFIYAASLNLNIIYKIRDINSNIILKKLLMKEFDGRYSEKFVDLILKMITFNEDKRVDFIELENILKEDF